MGILNKDMKKKKLTIKHYQQALAATEKLLSEAQRNINLFENRDWEHRREICEILMNGNNYYPAYRTSSSDVKSWADIKIWIARLGGMVAKEGEMNTRINANMDAENARLWYIVRVVTRDPLLQVPVRPDVMRDIFGNEPKN